MQIAEQLDTLARFEPVPYPVVSLYLNTQPNERGRDQYQSFIRQEFKSRSRTYPARIPGTRQPRQGPGADRDISRERTAAVGERRRDLRLLGR